MQWPRMFSLRQTFAGPTITDVPAAVEEQLRSLKLEQRIEPGQSVAIPAGSRGIADIVPVLQTTVAYLQQLGARPFLVPAMGSHGGATAEGQTSLLARYGITPAAIGCEIVSSMQTVVVAQTGLGFDVHFDAAAFRADHVLVVNRVKPHTRFTGNIESGLHKMLLIGLGKHSGASLYHRAIVDHDWETILAAVTGVVLEKCKIAGGLAILENARDQTALIAAVPTAEFARRERELLKIAREWLPRLPFDAVDLLIIDRIGKDISGAGLDTNIVGRKFDDKKSMPRDLVQVKSIFVRGLSEGSHGNATGLGIADFTNDRTAAAVDRRTTAINCVTGIHPTAGAIPITFPTDRECVEAGLTTLGLVEPPNAKVLHIADTLRLETLRASEAYWNVAQNLPNVEILSQPEPLVFDAAGNLPPV